MQLPIYFISDVHFYLKSNDTEKEKISKVSALIDQVIEKKATLLIVGDFFDFWFEYKDVVPRQYFQILSKLNEAKQSGCEIHYIAGNHDFWLGDFMEKEIGVNIHLDPIELKINNKRFYIAHGDGIDENDKGYLFLKKILRHKFFIKLFSIITPSLTFKIARSVSHTSRKLDKTDPGFIAAEQVKLKKFVRQKFSEGYDYIVMGHYHSPELMAEDGQYFINCGDWINHFSYGYFDGEMQLKYWGK